MPHKDDLTALHKADLARRKKWQGLAAQPKMAEMALALTNQNDYRVNDVNKSMRSYEVGSITLFDQGKCR